MYPEYRIFLDRNLGFIKGTLAYFAWIDAFFFANQLPNWLIHKDQMDLLAYRLFDSSSENEEDLREELFGEDPVERYHISDYEEEDADLLEAFFY